VRAINGFLTIGKGQRMGLFAGSGVGKSVLLGMLTQFAKADIIVLGLIGERGREVQEFIRDHIGLAKNKSVVVAAPADESPYHRLQGAFYASRIAEFFRDQGHSVLLLVDSLTRVAQAKRELALALGEMPASRGFPPSVFQTLPSLVERAGNDAKGGAITALYTVLAEGDDLQDPVVDCARAILDGHIVLSRKLAEKAHYPAIDIEASISRVASKILSKSALQHSKKIKQLMAYYSANQDFIKLGVYQEGKDPFLDEAIQKMPKIESFLQQEENEKVDLNACLQLMEAISK
jgi:flagellum-specific ATP synthase